MSRDVTPSDVLRVDKLRKVYGDLVAVGGLSFAVQRGEIVGLLGPNGAGKTSTISMILGVLGPSSGSIVIGGIDLAQDRGAALGRTNFAAVYAPLPGNLTVRQNLRIFSLIYAVKDSAKRVNEVLDEFDLRAFANTRCGVLSSGEQTRVCLAKAMLNKPALLLLDEPTASLDPATARTIRAQIRKFADGGEGGVLWTSHNMYEVEEVCDRVLLLARGQILMQGQPSALLKEHEKGTLEDLFVAVARDPAGFAVRAPDAL